MWAEITTVSDPRLRWPVNSTVRNRGPDTLFVAVRLHVLCTAIPILGNYHLGLERLWSGGIVRSELSGPQGAIAECNTPGPKARMPVELRKVGQPSTSTIVRWIASAAAFGSGALRIGRPTTI